MPQRLDPKFFTLPAAQREIWTSLAHALEKADQDLLRHTRDQIDELPHVTLKSGLLAQH